MPLCDSWPCRGLTWTRVNAEQLIVAARASKRPKFAAHERGMLVLLARLLPRWRDAVLLVKPETILRWHREGFRTLWRWKSKQKSPTSKLPAETIHLIRRMAEIASGEPSAFAGSSGSWASASRSEPSSGT